mgnify:CR=1 FL=1
MFLAFNLADIINVPFGYVMDYLYRFTNNYGLTLILFALIVQLVLIPLLVMALKKARIIQK